jgi:hypothetical protein
MFALLRHGCFAVLIHTAVFLTAAAGPAMALDDVPSLRCGEETVSIGDSMLAVRKACGPPDRLTLEAGGAVQKWIYNFGPGEFVHYLDFFNDRLERIQTGEYGWLEEK